MNFMLKQNSFLSLLSKVIITFTYLLFFDNVSAQIDASLNIDSLSHIDYQQLHQANLNDVWAYADGEGNEYAIVGTSKGTSIVDVTDPNNPVEVFWLPGTESIWRDPCVYSDYAYITTEAEDGLTIIDLSSLPESTNLTHTLYTGPLGNSWQSAHTCFVSEDGYAYIFGSNRGNRGAIILDVHSNPMSPIEVGVFDDWYVHDGYERNDTLYLAHIYEGFISLVDVSDKANPVLIGTRTTPNNFAHNVWPSQNGQFIFTTDEVSGAFLAAYDISNPTAIVEVDRIQNSPGVGVIPHNTHVKGDYTITSYYSDGVIIHDVTYPYNIIKVASYDTYPGQTTGFDGCWGVYPFLPSGTILATDITKGLFVLNANYQKASYLEGTVRDESNNQVLNDVTVQIISNDQKENTNASGFYATGLFGTGTYQVSFFKVGYYPKTETVQLIQGQIVNLETVLTPIPPFALNVRVYEAGTSIPITDAIINLKIPLITHEGNSNGLGERDFALYYAEEYQITVGKWGYISNCFSQVLDENTITLNVELTKGYYDDFELDFGWIVTGTASKGVWEIGVPNPTDGTMVGFDAPYDCGVVAFVTGNDPNFDADFDDVDEGETILISPQMDLTSYTTPYINYARAFFCFHGEAPFDDTLKVFLSNGTNSVLIDQIGAPQGNLMSYEYVSIPIAGLLPITNTMQLTVKISDEDPTINITEAAFDHFRVTENSTLSVDEAINQTNAIIFPNPISEHFQLLNSKIGEEISIFDLQGNLIVHIQMTEENQKINIESLDKGTYLVYYKNAYLKVIKF